MPEKFIVPQFIDSEDKILGPITVRQFLVCIAAVFVVFIEYSLFTLAPFILTALPTIGLAAVFAFLKINGQPFHLFFVNFVQTYSRPGLRIWDKRLNDFELRARLKKIEEVPSTRTPTKMAPSSTRLRDLALTVNTGGVYTTDDDEI